MFGLAIGDAMSWTSMFHRSVLLPPWTRRIRREIDTASETTNVIVTPMPFSLNQPAELLDQSPAMCTEWSVFTANVLLNSDRDEFESSILSAWKTLASGNEQIRGYVSTQAALTNLRNGLLPPHSGKQNPHYFDDSAMSRSVSIGIICSGRPDLAARLALADASVTNSEDGIWAAQAMAIAVSMLTSGKSYADAFGAAMQILPHGSWIERTVRDALSVTDGCRSIISMLPELQKRIVNREYSYGNVAPETLALSFAIVRLHENDVESALQAALCFPKSAESLPAIVGALSGAGQTGEIMNGTWNKVIATLKGISIPSLNGKEFIPIVEQLAQRAERSLAL